MTIFDALTMIGGLCLFLFGMNVMGQALEVSAGRNLRNILAKLTNNISIGFFTGLIITMVIQSSSATTVMVVGFVNSGLLTLKQSIGVIIGANVGTTVTAWILSLQQINGEIFWLKLLKPSAFTPVLAVIGIFLFMFCKGEKKKNIGLIFLGFATLMTGMDTMSSAVEHIGEQQWFIDLLVLFENPLLGILVGTLLTALIQSSSASVGILQIFANSTPISIATCIPIILGMNIGTCITAMLSSIGATKNGKRAAYVHLSFNIIGTFVLIAIFWPLKSFGNIEFFSQNANMWTVAACHTVLKIACTLLLLPSAGLLEKISYWLIPLDETPEQAVVLDERLFATPSIAIERSREVTVDMANCAIKTLTDSLDLFDNYTPELAQAIRDGEEKTDKYEDALGSYLVKLSNYKISASDSAEAAMLLKLIGDFERISDHGVNILEAVEELREKKLSFSEEARKEISVMINATREVLEYASKAFVDGDIEALAEISPLEQVIDVLKETLRSNHIARLQKGNCSIEVGFVWSDLITDLERTSDHCSNIAGCLIDLSNLDMNIHEHLRAIKSDDNTYKKKVSFYTEKYAV
ncbi:MAG: Na/Pi cotransporter family protein [Ruminococcaceae bacterium]|nr:Na/Pi cotransporter family protein [Oscillospiraceae bacterium]